MESIFGDLLSFLLLYKYFALFMVSFLAAFLLPLPSSSSLAAAGAFAVQGYMNIYLVFLVALIGNVLGDLAGYMLGRHYGEEILHKIGFKHILESKYYHASREYMNKYSYSLIFISRFLTGVGPSVSIFAGIMKMPYKKFLAVDIPSEICYVSLYALIGYLLGNQWEDNIWFVIEASLVVFSFGGIIALIQYKMFKRRTKI